MRRKISVVCARVVRLGLAGGVLLGALVAARTGVGTPSVTWVVHCGVDGTVRFAVRISGVQWVVTGLVVLLLTGPRAHAA
jgi:hypothetical protein